jgi:PKD repeat protein
VLLIESENNCSNQVRKVVKIYSLPIASFSPNTACSQSVTTLTETSTSWDGTVNSWLWLLPDSSQQSTKQVEFVFTSSGANPVQLIVETDLGCKDTLVKTIDVKEGPAVDFSFSAPCNGYPVYFTDESESFLNSKLQYLWTFGEEVQSIRNNPVFTFSDTGTYTVLLEVKQQINNCNNSVSKTIRVNENPSAAFNQDVFCEKTPGQLIDMSTSPNSTITNHRWEIETLGTFLKPNIELLFDSIGFYKASLFVNDANNCFDSISSQLEVYALPDAHFLTDVQKGPVPLLVEFYNQTIGASIYTWNFGDGGSSEDLSPTHTYTDSGTFEIKLLATTEMGCSVYTFGSVKAIVPRVDIAVLELNATIENEFLNVSTVIQNRGTLDLENVELFYKANYGQPFKEVLSTTLASGQTLSHNFVTQMQLNPAIELTHVCVTALPDVETDNVPENNEKCLTFENAFKAMHPYPNPVKEELIIEYIIPFDANVKIELFNQYGKVTNKLYNGTSKAGFNRHKFDAKTLSRGSYIYRIEYEGILKSYQIVIQ